MYFVLFVLNDPSKCDEILFAWEDAGVKGITILASTGLGRVKQRLALQEDFPIFPSLEEISEHSESLSRTLFTIVESEEVVEKIRISTENVIGSLLKPNTGILIVLPVAQVFGYRENSNLE
jgi:nitrogen regulatory protein PII